jgi:glycosyltransferase involved in cell wall biosynthesis
MAAGKATITTTIGAEGIPIAAGKEAFIADQPGEFAKHIVSLAKNPGLCDETGINAKDFIRANFDNKLLIQQLIKFLNTIDTGS